MVRTAKRTDLDLDYVIQSLLKHDTYEEIARKETSRIGSDVSRGLVAGVHRDLKDGKLRPSSVQAVNDRWIKTYVYGAEPDNGGVPLFLGEITLPENNYIVASDFHAPYVDYKFAETIIPVAKHHGIYTLIIAGDLVDGGTQNNFRHKVKPMPFGIELGMARKLLVYYAEWFDEIIFIPGNHDDWFLQNQDGGWTIDDYALMLQSPELEGKLTVSAYDRISFVSGGEEWLAPHQAEANVGSLVVGEKLSFKYHKNIIVPHQHNTAIGYDRYGRYVIVDIGGMHDENAVAYMNLKTTTKPHFDKGYAVIDDGQAVLITPDNRLTQWKKYI
jgi:calcineurin-like phosphoesterase family protein